MDREQDTTETDPPMPPDPMRDRAAEADDVRRPDGEPPVPPVPMRDRGADAEESDHE